MNSDILVFCLLITPALSAFLLAIPGLRSIANYLNIFVSFITFIFAVLLTINLFKASTILAWHQWFYIDKFNTYIILLSTFIGFSTSLYNVSYLQNEIIRKKLSSRNLRYFNTMYQFFIFTLLLALLSNNLGILWVAMEGATLATVLLVSLYRTPTAIEAAWKYLILCGVGITQALLGTILVYFAAEKILGSENALLWSQLHAISSQLSPEIMKLAFIFLLVGYGTKAGLVPLHNWLPDAHSEAPAPVSALLSGLLLNVALYAIIRCKLIVDGAIGQNITNHLLIIFGLLNIIVAAFFLLRQKEIKRLFAYSSIEHIGLICFAFGLNSALAIFAAMLHMAMHSLSKTAAFFTSGQIIQQYGKQTIADIRGLLRQHPSLAWGFMFTALAIMGMPPFGVFASEFLLAYATIQQQPWLFIILSIGLLISFAAILGKIQAMIFSEEATTPVIALKQNLMPAYVHLALVLLAGITTPLLLVHWFADIAKLFGMTS